MIVVVSLNPRPTKFKITRENEDASNVTKCGTFGILLGILLFDRIKYPRKLMSTNVLGIITDN